MGEIADCIRRLRDAGTDLDTIIGVVEAMEKMKPQRKAKAETRAARLPLDWEIPDEWIDWALGEFPGMPVTFARQQSLTFKDYWISRGRPMVDWQATWRNWMRKAVEDHRRKHGRPGAAQSVTERRREALAERVESGYRTERERGDDPQDARRLFLARH